MIPTLYWHHGCWLLLIVLHETNRGASAGSDLCRRCPYFLHTPVRVTTAVGSPVNLTCGVRMLGDRQVSWIRRRDLHVLATDSFAYTTDARFRALHEGASPYWVLSISEASAADSGVYECQVSAQPKMSRRFTLDVVVPRATIAGSSAVFMKAGSDLNITCLITGASARAAAPVTWYHVSPSLKSRSAVSEELNSGGRGGIQLVTDRRAGTSWLLVTNATWKDAGNYTCSPGRATPASVAVHVLDEESPAAMQPHLQPSTLLPPSSTPTSTSTSSISTSSSSSSSSSSSYKSLLSPTNVIYVTTAFLVRSFSFKTTCLPGG